jgi:hypothetical protein
LLVAGVLGTSVRRQLAGSYQPDRPGPLACPDWVDPSIDAADAV